MGERTSLARRTFLTALGLGVAAPLAYKMARLAEAAPTGNPVRLLNLFVPHGLPWEMGDPAPDGETLDLMAPGADAIFAPLEPYSSHVNMIRGCAMAAGQSNHTAISTMWTGSAGGSSDSFDYLLAGQLGTKARTLGAIPYSKTEGFNVDSYLIRHGGQWVRARESPSAAADEIFFGTGGDEAVDEGAFRAEAMDLTASQIERLAERAKGLSAEENKLSIHLAALQDLKATDSSVSSCTDRPMMPLVEATRSLDPLDEAQFGKIFDAHLELAGHAMRCGAASVLSLHALWVNSNLMFNFEGGPGLAAGHHLGLSHGSRAQFAQAQRWFMERLATVLLPLLDDVDPLASDGSTVLDNSIVYLSSEISDGANHNSDAGETWVAGAPSSPMYTCLPQFLIGGGGGYLKKGGNVVNVQEDRQHTDVMATIADAMGSPLQNIGDSPAQVIKEAQS